ncbi:MAG: ABC transporter permease subunit [Rhodospirillales bacterium]|nr:ABC transporter permease subunit [Rhodospirillales bacterium]
MISLTIPVIGLLLFFVYPLAIVFLRSITEADGGLGLGNYAHVLASKGFWRATGHSLHMGLATTAISIGLGFVIAHALHRCAFRGKVLIRAAIALPLLAPSLVQGLGLIFLLGRNGLVNKWFDLGLDIYGFWGLLIANIFYALPQAVMIIGATLTLSDARTYEAAEVMGARPIRQFLDITLPNAKFGVLSAAFVVFTVTITDFGNAAVIGGDYSVLATEIYSQVIGQMNFNMGAVVGIMLLLPTVASYYIERLAQKRQFGSHAENAVPFVPTFTPARDLPMAAASFLIAALIAIVIVVVVYASFVKLWPYNFGMTVKHYDITLAGGYAPLWTTIYISLAAAIGGTVMLFLLGLGIRKAPDAIAKAVYFFSVMPAAVPGMVIGLAYVLTFNSTATPLYLLYGTATLLAVCNFYHYHTQGFLTAMTGFRQVPSALEEAASCLGSSMTRIAIDVVAPYVTPMLISIFFFLFMRSMVTLSAVIFLTTPKMTVASVTIMRLDDAGLTSQAAAYSTCIMLIVGAALMMMKYVFYRMDKRSTLGTVV